jgi:hypothetical protein
MIVSKEHLTESGRMKIRALSSNMNRKKKILIMKINIITYVFNTVSAFYKFKSVLKTPKALNTSIIFKNKVIILRMYNG